jgi:Fe-S cluster biogenesis protein NfuA
MAPSDTSLPPDDPMRALEGRIDTLLADIAAAGDGALRRSAEELVRLLFRLYGAGLERVVELAGEEVVGRLAGDQLVGSLLILHDLHPLDTEARVSAALEEVRPHLGSHAGGVDLVGVGQDGVVRLRLEGSCDGCPSSTVTVKLAIERAIMAAAPEVTRIDVEGGSAPAAAAEPQLLQIQPMPREAPGPCPVPAPPAGQAAARVVEAVP